MTLKEAIQEVSASAADYDTCRMYLECRGFMPDERGNFGGGNYGDENVGYCNVGLRNIGDFNRGKFNRGNHNEGDWNIGDYNEDNDPNEIRLLHTT